MDTVHLHPVMPSCVHIEGFDGVRKKAEIISHEFDNSTDNLL